VKREYILGVLFFGGVWGMSEAVLGNALYASNVPHASVLLTAVGLMVLTIARCYFPQRGTATLVAACAMLYKFLNSPFFGCHLLGILLTGACYDFVFDVLKIRLKSLAAAAATYLSYAGFAVMITYIFRYDPWVQGGLTKVLEHIFINGSMAALACACLVPLSARLGERLKSHSTTSFGRLRYPIPGGISVLTLGLWAFAVVMCLLSYPSVR
jgi:ABC-type thiamin/hydroxymethylpyrimidine transport system permease subunit